MKSSYYFFLSSLCLVREEKSKGQFEHVNGDNGCNNIHKNREFWVFFIPFVLVFSVNFPYSTFTRVWENYIWTYNANVVLWYLWLERNSPSSRVMFCTFVWLHYFLTHAMLQLYDFTIMFGVEALCDKSHCQFTIGHYDKIIERFELINFLLFKDFVLFNNWRYLIL